MVAYGEEEMPRSIIICSHTHDSRNLRLGEYANDVFALTDLVDVRNNVIYN